MIYTWNSSELQDHCYSLVDYVETNSKELRAKYLAFTHDVGEYKLNGKPIIEHLSDSRGYSLWWMSKLAEKSHLNTPQLTDCIKLFALEKILLEEEIGSVVIRGDTHNIRLLDAIKSLCINLDIEVSSQIRNRRKRFNIKESLHRYRPEILSVIFWLFRYLKLHWVLRNRKEINWFSDNKSIMVFSYFFGLDVDKCSKGKFYSKQWGILPEKLQNKGIKINWIHHFMRFNGMNDTNTALSWIEHYNDNPEQQGQHAFFESQLSFLLILNVLLSYTKFFLKSFALINVRDAFRPKESSVDLWPILKNEWVVSVRGGAAIRNCMFIALVDSALKNAPHQKNAFYLQENQFWERALIHAWRRYGHGIIVGFPNGAVNYWDMRYFDDKRTISENGRFCQPQPDLVALHGPVAKKHFINAGYSLQNIIEVEALPYLHLDENKHDEYHEKVHKAADKVNVLIVGEFQLESTLEMLHAIGMAISQNDTISSFVFKPHPACPIDESMITMLDVSFTSESLDLIVPNFDIAIVAGSTSAAVDLYYSGIDVVVYLGTKELNLSPLREKVGSVFVRTASDFKNILSRVDNRKYNVYDNEVFFWTNKNLPRWNLLLNIMGYDDD
jgi:surface carbohydrate biosynthesis protein (TIGR04326 family)